MERTSYRVRIEDGAQGIASRFLGSVRPAEGLKALPSPLAYCYDNVGDALAAVESEPGRAARRAPSPTGMLFGYVIERVPTQGENPCRTQPMLTVRPQVDRPSGYADLMRTAREADGQCGHNGCTRPGAGGSGNCEYHDLLADLIDAARELVAQTRGQGFTGTDQLEAAIVCFERGFAADKVRA